MEFLLRDDTNHIFNACPSATYTCPEDQICGNCPNLCDGFFPCYAPHVVN